MSRTESLTVKELAALAQVSVRTLHFYDEIDLLKPSHVGGNGYRYYNEAALYRLQQILLYRETGVKLEQIKRILDDEKFDPEAALRQHREQLLKKIGQLQTVVRTVESTLKSIKEKGRGGLNMAKKKRIFDGFSEEKHEQHKDEAEKRYGDTYRESARNWESYSPEKRKAIIDEGNQIYSDIANAMELGEESLEVQEHLARWHKHLHNFYQPTLMMLRGLGQMYETSPDFNATFTAIDPELPGFLNRAIEIYVSNQEAGAR